MSWHLEHKANGTASAHRGSACVCGGVKLACVYACVDAVEVLCGWAGCCSGMMLDDITHRNQERKRHFLCHILLIISLEYPPGSNVCVSM